MTARTRRRLIVNLGVVLLVSSLVSLAVIGRLLGPLQLQSSDLVFRLKRDTTARWAVLVAIDDRSLTELRAQGRLFNWPRQLYARAIDNLRAAGARMIVLDVLFDAPAEGDAELARAMRDANNVILAEVAEVGTRLPGRPDQLFRYAALIEQRPEFRGAAIAIGHANQIPDPDGTIRAVPLIINVDGQDVPALPLVAAAKFLRRPEVLEAPIRDGKLPFAGREIPVDQEGRMWISYLGDSSEVTNPPTFPTISFVEALNNRFPPESVRGKIVFIGVTATAFADDYWTPVSRQSKMDGVELHANAFETIMRPEEFIVPASREQTIGLVYLAGVIAVVALSLLSPVPAVIAGVLAGLAYFAVAVLAVDQDYIGLLLSTLPTADPDAASGRTGGIILDLTFPLLNLGLCYLGVLVYHVVFEQAEGRALRGALSQYLSPNIMEEVARDPGAIRLGGEKREMTVLFSDLRGFTSLSETLEPERLVHLLNRYLTRMSEVIFRHDGTIDKYMGDAIMAFWGAPRFQPDHARLACLAALEMDHELERLDGELERDGLPRLREGIGLNSGPMAVGNMGSERRFDYTVMGDAVNLGSRLEGLNKEYGTRILIAEATLAQAGPGIRARFVDLVAVKGKQEPTAVYELLAAGASLPAAGEAAIAAYERGIAGYRAGQYAEAIAHFEEALRHDPNDGPSGLYLDRAREMLANPPPADWDGVYVMTRK